ncbi:MAG: hypothetical protein KKH28_12660 [Elusimicrobia bacterium]|nr:hypothetical protein [Elusimicrobiota bacterium]
MATIRRFFLISLFAVLYTLYAVPCSLHAGLAILWIPREHSNIDDVLLKLETDTDIKLTAALSEAPPALAEKIKDLRDAGRLELAARAAGDPVLPLFYYPKEESVLWQDKPSSAAFSNDPYFLALRLSDAGDAFAKNFKRPPEGLAVSPGGTIAGYIPLAKALGFSWLASGPLVSTAAFTALKVDGVFLAPFSFYSTAAPAGADFFTVFDETLDRTRQNETRAQLLAALNSGLHSNYLTVSEALKTAVSTTVGVSDALKMTRPWSEDYTPWAARKIQAGTLAAFARTRADLMLHLNSKQGDYKAAKNAFTEYFSVESGPRLLKLCDEDPEAVKETEIEIQNALGNSYRMMNKTLPGWLFSSLADLTGQAGDEDLIAVVKSSAGFTVKNVSKQPVPPADTPGLAKTYDPYKIWKLNGFEAYWSDNGVTFSFAPLELILSASEPGGFAHACFDLYIDINHRPRAGSTRPLNGRDIRIFPDDAWEYALAVDPQKAVLYAVTPKGPRKMQSFRPEIKNGAVTVSIPGALLKGNPANWGYAAFMLARKGKLYSISDFIAEDFSNGYYYAVRPRQK